MYLLMFGIGSLLTSFVWNFAVLVLGLSAIALIVYFVINKFTGSNTLGRIGAGGSFLLIIIWLAKEGHLIDYLSNVG